VCESEKEREKKREKKREGVGGHVRHDIVTAIECVVNRCCAVHFKGLCFQSVSTVIMWIFPYKNMELDGKCMSPGHFAPHDFLSSKDSVL
jgi:hypothetical protein